MIGDTLNRAVERHRAGALDEAVRLYRRVLVEEPAEGNALHLLGLIQTRRDGDDAATLRTGVGLIERGIAAAPHLIPPLTNLSHILHVQGDDVRAAALLRRWLAFDPADAAALERLGRIHLTAGRLDAAEAALRRAERLGSDGERLGLALERCALYRSIARDAADPALPAGLVVRGVFRDGSGYAHTVRQFVRHLLAAGVRVRLIDLLFQPTDDLALDQLPPELSALDRPVRAKAVLSFTTPNVVERIPGLKTINYSLFEAARVPESFARHSRTHDRLIVATESSRAAWIASGAPGERIEICPEGVEPIDAAQAPPMWIGDSRGRRLASYRTRFLNISDFNPRKNLRGLLRVWFRATRAEDDAALLIKIGKTGDMARLFAAWVRQAMDELDTSLDAVAPIFLVDGKFSDADMLSLLASCSHYWSMSHGEGWDLPMAQAGAMGLTLLAPRHSAYTAYLDDEVAYMLPSEEVDGDGAYKGLRWWRPDEDAAVDLVARIIRDPENTRRSARERLARAFTWDQAAARLIDCLSRADAL